MAQNVSRPTAARQYQTPGDGSTVPGANYRDAGVPASREPEPTLGMRRNPSAHTAEPAQPPPHGHQPAPPIGSRVEHRVSGQRGTVADHRPHGYGQAVPAVRWDGEDHSWPQGVSANALRVVGSRPSDLYQSNDSASNGRPMRGTGGGQGQ